MSKIQIVLDFEDWYKVIDALKFSEFDHIISSKTLGSSYECDELIKKYKRDSLTFDRLSKEIYGQIYSGVFLEGYELKKKELEHEEREKLDSDCVF